MSTILKALKKLEQDKAAPTPPGPLPISGVQSASTPGQHHWHHNRPLGRILLLGTVGCLLLVITIYMSINSGDSDDQVPTVVDGSLPPSKPVAAQAKKVADEPRLQPPAITAREKREAPQPEKTPPVHPPRTETTPVAGNNIKQSGASVTNEQVPAVPSQTAGTATISSTEIPRMADGRVKVHAIAWSTNPEKRSAVVNASIVHEQDTVDGFTVVSIDQEAVVLRDQEEVKWRVVIGRP